MMRLRVLPILLWTALPAVALADSAIDVIHRDSNGRNPTYVRVSGVPLPGIGVAAKQEQQRISSELLRRFSAPIFHLSPAAELALGQARIQPLRNGAARYTYQQHFDDLSVLNGKLTVLTDTQQSVRVLSGQPAQQAPLSRHRKDVAEAHRLLTYAAQAIGAMTPARWSATKTVGNELRLHGDKGLHGSVSFVRATPVYVVKNDATVPAWSFELEIANGRSSRLWQVVIDQTGEILRKHSRTRDAAYSYKVYAHNTVDMRPIDSPYGDLTPLPAGELNLSYSTANTLSVDELASNHSNSWLPASSTTLTGNHAEAYLDNSGSDGFDASDRRGPISAAGQFHWTFDGVADVRTSAENQNAAMVQAFFVANWLHDYFYDAGFVETDGTAEGGSEAEGGDHMLIELQDTEDTNNANMSVPPDGQSPRLQVFLFDGPTEHAVSVTGAIAASYDNGRASFGPDAFNHSGLLVILRDDAGLSATDGCETVTNAAELSGKIAFVDRGNCNFIDKINRAQQAGALGVLVANNTTGTLTMGLPDGTQPTITIGSLLISQSDANAVKSAMQSGPVTATLTRTTATPIDGALDSALVAHEWGHYINNRLMDIGSVNQANGMDEGWSDFIALFALSAAGDEATGMLGSFGFSGYAVNDFANGLRRFPYSADLTINRLSFRHISNGVALPDGRAGTTNNEVHNTGEIWASALWDAYVNLVRTRGYSAAQLRMREYLVQGMKSTPSQPDFVEARDAQLDAVSALQPIEAQPDDLNLFRQAFARRGLGINAVAPSKADDTQNGVIESFVWTTTQVPTISAGSDQTVIQGDVVQLNGTANDSDGTIASYQWTQLSGPSVTLDSNSNEDVSFTAPSVSTTTTLVFELTVSDTTMEKASDQVVVTVSPAPNSNPTANAGADQSVNESSTVTLSGSGTDTDGTVVSYRWTQTSGSNVTLANSAAASTTFTAPTVNADAELVFLLTVTDNLGATATDSVSVLVRNVSTPPPTGGGGGGGGAVSWWLAALLPLMIRRRQTQ